MAKKRSRPKYRAPGPRMMATSNRASLKGKVIRAHKGIGAQNTTVRNAINRAIRQKSRPKQHGRVKF